MIPIVRAPEPSTFDAVVRQPGLRAVAEMCGRTPPTPRRGGRTFQKIANRPQDIPVDRLPPYWTACLDDLMAAYDEICAYSCFRIHRVTGASSADHFAAKSHAPGRAYEWSNYRLCSSRLNARKQAASVLDPFRIERGWFQLELVAFQVHPERRLPRPLKARIQQTIDRLRLNDSRFQDERAEDAEDYWHRGVPLHILKRESPFVAYELMRQRRLNPGDPW